MMKAKVSAVNRRVGIFAGSFDPVHKGHLTFALQAIKAANLDEVYFLPEVKPRRKEEVSHISHRLAMLKLATRPYPKLKVLELPDKQFLVKTTLPRIKRRFRDSELYLLMGNDVLEYLPEWPLAERLVQTAGLVVAGRDKNPKNENLINFLRSVPNNVKYVDSPNPEISSTIIRLAAAHGKQGPGSLDSVNSYIKKNWLYSTAPKSS